MHRGEGKDEEARKEGVGRSVSQNNNTTREQVVNWNKNVIVVQDRCMSVRDLACLVLWDQSMQ
jgi:hypothetical protein